ncbi:hypothetical protein B0H11DRAFT_1974752 [Mycena galericulata]|nr:hypothetical protein B0H11DRAFT_1974752 [Mycena galericulata]
MGTAVLSCGADDPSGDIYYYPNENPVQPQILPIPLEAPSPSVPSRKRKRSNGCGMILHYGAIVSSNNMWRAGEIQYGYIIHLEDQYFPVEVRRLLELGVKPCGCVRRGVGCAACGNSLGALFTPCVDHQESASGKNYYTILPGAVSPPVHPYRPSSPSSMPPPRALRPLPSSPPPNYTRHRHPTSPPPLILYAEFTPTPSPEIRPASLPEPSFIEETTEWETTEWEFIQMMQRRLTRRIPTSASTEGWGIMGGTEEEEDLVEDEMPGPPAEESDPFLEADDEEVVDLAGHVHATPRPPEWDFMRAMEEEELAEQMDVQALREEMIRQSVREWRPDYIDEVTEEEEVCVMHV